MKFPKPAWWSKYMEQPPVAPPFQARSATVGGVEPTATPRPPLKYLLTGLAMVAILGLWMSGGSSSQKPAAAQRSRRASVPTTGTRAGNMGRGVPPAGDADTRTPEQRQKDADDERDRRDQDAALAQLRSACAAGITSACTTLAGMQGSNQARAGANNAGMVTPQQTAAEERKKKEEQSLEAPMVIPAPEPDYKDYKDYRNRVAATLGDEHILTAKTAPAASTQMAEAAKVNTAPQPPAVVLAPEREDCKDTTENDQILYALCEGTDIPAVLENRIEGEFAGPIKAYLLVDVLSRDKHRVLPVGTMILGEASAVQKQNQRRIEGRFHRMLLPNGDGVKLNKTLALDQAGETALAGKVNNHLVKTFATAGLFGLMSGFSQFGAGSAYTGSGVDAFRQQAAAGIAREGQQIVGQNMTNLPTIRIPEGKRIIVKLNADLHLPEYIERGASK